LLALVVALVAALVAAFVVVVAAWIAVARQWRCFDIAAAAVAGLVVWLRLRLQPPY